MPCAGHAAEGLGCFCITLFLPTPLPHTRRLKPDYADAYCDLGCTYCAMGEVDKAKRCFAAALEHNLRHLEVRRRRGGGWANGLGPGRNRKAVGLAEGSKGFELGPI